MVSTGKAMQTSERACQCGNMQVQEPDAGVVDEADNNLAEFWVDCGGGGALSRGACPECGSLLQPKPPWKATWHPGYQGGE